MKTKLEELKAIELLILSQNRSEFDIRELLDFSTLQDDAASRARTFFFSTARSKKIPQSKNSLQETV